MAPNDYTPKEEPDLSSPEVAEEKYVHDVYQHIAGHFSQTRYKPWPIVEKYLLGLSPGSIGLDIGCGNGKYLLVNKKVFIIGSDRSSELVKIAKSEKSNAEVMVADALDLPYRPRYFDFAISIAVIHHFSSPQRRIKAVESILSTLRDSGTALIYVWALEQKNSRRGWDDGMAQDVFVPWVTKSKAGASGGSNTNDSSEIVQQRYYHLYKKGELEADVISAGGITVESGYERDNWWAIIKPAPDI